MKKEGNPARSWPMWLAMGLAGIAAIGWGHALAAEPAPGAAAAALSGPPASPPNPTPVASEEPIPTANLWDIIGQGGLLMIPIAFCSLLLLAFVFERTVSLRRSRIIPKPFVTRILQQVRDGGLDRQRALALCQENPSPVAAVFAGAVRKWGRPAVEVEQAILDAGERATHGLRRYLRIFNGIATVSPLLGLLGTVVGMIRSFNAIAISDAMGRPQMLAEGISQALLTTAAGLTVAIPALIFYMYFVSRVDRLIIDIDALGQELVNTISAEELQHRTEKAHGPKGRRKTQRESAA